MGLKLNAKCQHGTPYLVSRTIEIDSNWLMCKDGKKGELKLNEKSKRSTYDLGSRNVQIDWNWLVCKVDEKKGVEIEWKIPGWFQYWLKLIGM